MPRASNPIVFANSALAAADSAEILFLTSNKALQDAHPLFNKSYFGAIILGTFGLELLLKSIHVFLNEDDTFISGHRLNDLYDQIPDQSLKNEIVDAFNSVSNINLVTFLNEHAHSFQEWRYFAEEGSNTQSFDVSSVRSLTSILKSIVLRYATSST